MRLSNSPRIASAAVSPVANATIALALVLAAFCPPKAAFAELLDSRPVIAVGVSEADDRTGQDRTIANYSLGWRFTLQDFAWSDGLAEKAGLDLNFVVESLFGVLTAHSDTTVEFSVVPMFRFELRDTERWTPYVEGGVGLIYNDLRGFDLGSRILFADQIGFGIARRFDSGVRLGLGYRLRHISHAGLWADANDGLNTHFLVFTFD